MRVRIRLAAAAIVWVAAWALAGTPQALGQVAALDPRWELLGAPTDTEPLYSLERNEFLQPDWASSHNGAPVVWTIPRDPARTARPHATTGEHPAWPVRVVVLDDANERIFAVGIDHRAHALSLRTWEWANTDVTGLPPPEDFGRWSVVRDPARRRWIVFGGVQSIGGFFPDLEPTNRVWALSQRGDSLHWEELFPAGVPPQPRYAHGAAMDAESNRMFVFGGLVKPAGSTHAELANDLWELELVPNLEWRPLPPLDVDPPHRAATPLLVQPVLDRVVLLPGPSVEAPESELWAFPLDHAGVAAWAPLPTTGTPTPLWWPMGLDELRGTATYLRGTGESVTESGASYGGRSELDLSGAVPRWRELVAETRGPDAPGVAAYDFGRERVYTMYTRASGSLLPPAKMMLWSADVADMPAWSLVDSTAELANREGFALVHDPRRDRLVLFGGRAGSIAYGAMPAVLNDVWVRELPNGAWTPIAPDGSAPSPRAEHAAVYDPVGDRLLVFGGESYGDPAPAGRYGDLWELTLSGAPAWRRLDAGDPRPAPRARSAAALDTAARRLYVHGGADATAFGDLWSFSFDNGTWSPIATSGAGSGALAGHAMAFDGTRSLLLVLPAHVDIDSLGVEPLAPQRLWVLDPSATETPTWANVEPPGIVPPAVAGRRAFLSQQLDALVLYQDGMPPGYAESRERWFLRALRLGDGSDTASAGLVRAWADESGAHLRWRVAGSAAAWMSAERRTAGDGWRGLDFLDADRWLVAVDDATVVPGWTYEFRLMLAKVFDPAYSPIVRLTIPGGPATMRAQFAPVRNPAPTGPGFRFLLAGAPQGLARVDLLDVSGRRVGSTEIPISGAGPYTVDFARRTGRPGIYFARLSVNGAEVATARVVAFID